MSSSSTFDFARWPPALTDAQLDVLTHHATTYALAHGLTYLPPWPSPPPSVSPQQQHSSAIHAPLALLPTPLPRRLFVRAQRLQSAYNALYARVAMDVPFLDAVMGAVAGAGRADPFVAALWSGWKDIREEGIVQPLHLGIFRSDYLLHTGGEEGVVSLKQVEFNTISSSFGPLSERTAAMHRYLQALTGYFDVSPHLQPENYPPNSTTAGLVEGLAEAHKAYGVPHAHILFVVQPNERNIFDQRWLEYELLEKLSIRVVRQTLSQLASSAVLDPTTRALRVAIEPQQGIPALSTATATAEIAVVYFRAGYVPADYPTQAHYDTRFLLERSRAIKCPTIPLQLAGGKKVQEVLARPGVVERFMRELGAGTGAEELRETWMRLWALDDPDPRVGGLGTMTRLPLESKPEAEPQGTSLARTHAASLVLKPQREGGGNNVYKGAILPFLDALPARDREAWIAMELIVPPRGIGSYLVRAGADRSGEVDALVRRGGVVRTETVSELGIFGWALFSPETGVRERGDSGWLVRTKGAESDEGGVAAGFSVLDSIVLVDG